MLMNSVTGNLLAVILALVVGLAPLQSVMAENSGVPCHTGSDMTMPVPMPHGDMMKSLCDQCDEVSCYCASTVPVLLQPTLIAYPMVSYTPQFAVVQRLPSYFSPQLYRPPRG